MNKNYITQIDLSVLLEKLEVTHDQFINICILSGCDYLSYVHNLAINTVYSLFKKHDTIEDIIKLNKYQFSEEYIKECYLNKIRCIFSEFEYPEPKLLENNCVNKIKLKDFLEKMNIKNPKRYICNF